MKNQPYSKLKIVKRQTQEISAPTTPAILHRGTEPPVLAPNCEDVTRSCTSAPVCARNAGAALPVSDKPETNIFSIFK
jgi:hypothetical protein